MVNRGVHAPSCSLDWGLIAWADAPSTPQTEPWSGPLNVCAAFEGEDCSSRVVIDSDLPIWPTAIVPSPDRRAFIVLASGSFDDNHEWWALAFSITKGGDLQEIGRTRKFHRGNRIEMSAYWSDSATGVIEWTREDIPQPPEIFSGIGEATQAPQIAKPPLMPINDRTKGDDGQGFVLGHGEGVPPVAFPAKPMTDEQGREPGNSVGDQHNQ